MLGNSIGESYNITRRSFLALPLTIGNTSTGNTFGFIKTGIILSYYLKNKLTLHFYGGSENEGIDQKYLFINMDFSVLLEGGDGFVISDSFSFLSAIGLQVSFVSFNKPNQNSLKIYPTAFICNPV